MYKYIYTRMGGQTSLVLDMTLRLLDSCRIELVFILFRLALFLCRSSHTATCRVQGSRFRVQGSGFRVQGSGSRVLWFALLFFLSSHTANFPVSFTSLSSGRVFTMNTISQRELEPFLQNLG